MLSSAPVRPAWPITSSTATTQPIRPSRRSRDPLGELVAERAALRLGVVDDRDQLEVAAAQRDDAVLGADAGVAAAAVGDEPVLGLQPRRGRVEVLRGVDHVVDAHAAVLPAWHYARPMPPANRPRRSRAHAPETPVEQREGEVLVWTDGACRGNPGPGGWAAIVVGAEEEPVELSGGAPQTTNNRMEYTAALEGLRSLPAGSRACVVTDSRLMLDSMTKWIHGWKRKGWKTAGGDPVKNQDLVRALDAEIARHEHVRWHWVRGHETGAQHAHKALNDRADRLAVAASHAAASVAPPSGPRTGAEPARAAAACRSASSANEHSALTSRICSTVLQRAHSSRGEQTTTASARARETATLSRLRVNRKSIPRGTSSPREAAIEKKTTGASWPWNLSTVPTRAPRGSRVAQVADLRVEGRDDEDVVEREVALGAGGVRVAAAVEQLRDLLGDPVGLLGRALAVLGVLDLEQPHARARQPR